MRAGTRAVLMVLLAATLLGAGTQAGANDVVKRRLGNGVTLIVAPNPWSRVAAVCVLVDAGSKYDPPEIRGLARLTNELLISGTTTMPRAELDDLVASRGIQLGTNTTEDFAEIRVASTADQFDAALDVLSALLTQPSFEGRDLPRAQKQAVEEQAWSQDDPFASCYAKLNEIMFDGHPYAFPAYGTKEGVAAATREDVQRFYAERYRGGNIVVAAVGNFNAGEAARMLGERFAACASGRSPGAAFSLEAPSEPASFEFHRDVRQGYVTIGFLAPPMGSDDCAAVRVMASVLGEGKTTLGRIREALSPAGGPAETAGAFFPERTEHGRLVLFASTPDVDGAASTLVEVAERLRTEPVPDEELAVAKERLLGAIALAGQTNLDRARLLATGELARLGYDYVSRFVRGVESVDAGDVRRVAAKYLTSPVTVVLRPGRTSSTQL